jgi:predicted transcriptional regulator
VILTPSQMKSIADKGRALPDEILAPLVLDAILGSAATRPAPTGERRAYVKMPDRIDELVAFLVANPGSAMRQIAPALGLARSHACIVVRQAVQTGRIEARGTFNATRYYAPQPKSEAPAPVERKPRGAGRAKAPQKRMDAAVAYVRMHPGCRMRDIMAGIGCPRATTRLAVLHAIQDGILELRGQRVDARYYARFYPASEAANAQPPVQAQAKPTVLLAEQRIDGEHKQTLVRLEHRKGIAKNEFPQNAQQRKAALVEYVRRNPGSSLTDIAAALGCEKSHAQYAIGAARQSGEIRMEGELGKARYYPRRYVNGSATQQAAVST